jgi:hypothetical protein
MTVLDGGRLNLPNRPRANVRCVGIAAPDGRMFLAMMLTRAGFDTSTFTTDNEFEAMVATLRFTSQPASALWDPLRPAKGGGGQSGIYWSNSLQNVLNPLGGMDLRATRHYVVLLPSGQAYNDLPSDGHVLDVDFATECRQKPKVCGTYEIQGGTIRFKWAGDFGLVEESEGAWVPGEKGSFKSRGDNYSRVPPVHNLRIDGRFTSTFAMVGTMAAQSTSIVSETYITLTADGRYQKSGFSSASFTNTHAAGTVGGNKGVTSGPYSMDGYTLTLTPVGAAPELYSLVLEDPTPNAGALFIDDKAFLKKGR